MKKILLILYVFLGLNCAVNAQKKVHNFGDYILENGSVLRNTRIGYTSYGELNAAKTNAILFPTWYGGTAESLKPYIGEGSMLDPSKYFIIVVEALGNGVSSSPSNFSDIENFPEFSIADMVNLQHKLLSEVLQISHLYAVTGISMGGMQTYQWMASYPNYFDKAIPIVGSAELTLYDKLNFKIFRNVLEAEIRGAARNGTHTMLEYTLGLTQEYFKSNNKTVEEFLGDIEKDMLYDPMDLKSQMIAILNFDLSETLGKHGATALSDMFMGECLIIYSSTDRLVSSDSNQIVGASLNAELIDLKSKCGHYSFSCDKDKISELVSTFLNKSTK